MVMALFIRNNNEEKIEHVKKIDMVNEVTEFIKKLDHSNIFPPKYSASEIMVTDTDKEGLSNKRTMTGFFCFRHVVYLEVLQQELLDFIKGGMFFAQVASVMWNEASQEDRDKYKELSLELKRLQINCHKDKSFNNRKKPSTSPVFNINNISLQKTKPNNNIIKKKKKIINKKQLQSEQTVDKSIIEQTPQQSSTTFQRMSIAFLVENLSNNESNEITEFIKKLDYTNIFPPKRSAKEIMVTELNKEGLPRRAMNCFFCFRHVVYLEIVQQKLLDFVKDGVFFTQVASEMWIKASQKDRENYKELASELKKLQINFHKDKTYIKHKPAGSVFVNMNDNNFLRTKTNNTIRKRKKNTNKEQVVKIEK
ncbi:unnamed protein product [Rhizophagus irregularis]|uniref:MATA-HMG n=1 Tax=Rhizophagus irregularis TaxID=588596 RepID=A0A1B1EVE0_9GLOM|nr:MATA-HMG [Rhizophagus irregularis]ANQ32795.1 MATA-HMG [Rhizophagus irregularis]CAB4460605.1 unnamed protein product [Rhizophagus irregularis]